MAQKPEKTTPKTPEEKPSAEVVKLLQEGETLPVSRFVRPGRKPVNEIETITPEVAAEMLENRLSNAHPNKNAVEKYANTMLAGGWTDNGNPIVFDENGVLIDGEHRLRACILADKPLVDARIAYNCRRDITHTIDQHRRRTFQQTLEARGVKHAGAITRTMTRMIRMANGAIGRDRHPISQGRLDVVFAANPEFVRAANISHQFRKSYLRASIRMSLAFMALKAKHEKDVFDFLTATTEKNEYPLDHPAAFLGNQIENLTQNGLFLDVDNMNALAILAFNDFVEGKTVRQNYVWTPDYGEAQLDKSGHPKNWKTVRETAPDNLGFPQMIDFPGTDEAVYEIHENQNEFIGEVAESLIEASIRKTKKVPNKTVLVTPEKAQEWLTKYNKKNRKIQPRHVSVLARDISNGKWAQNIQPICFTGDIFSKTKQEDMRMLNGQHRLQACIISGIPIEVSVAVNIPEEAFATYDMHAKGNTLGKGQAGDSRVVQAAAKLQWRRDNGIPETAQEMPSASEVKDTIEAHPELRELAGKARMSGYLELASTGIMVYFMHRVLTDDPDIAEDFLEQLRTGEGIQQGSPIARTRSKALKIRSHRSRKDSLTILLKGWEAYQKWVQKSKEEEDQSDLI